MVVKFAVENDNGCFTLKQFVLTDYIEGKSRLQYFTFSPGFDTYIFYLVIFITRILVLIITYI